MNSKFKVGILGLGGVGGYLGAKLAGRYHGSENTEITFIARGENLKMIRLNGLKLATEDGEQIAFPSFALKSAELSGKFDLIICCVKSYDLEKSLLSIRKSIGHSTIILPFLNGVDASRRIKNLFPRTAVCDGCAYIVSRLISPGFVRVSGNLCQFYIGSDNFGKKKIYQINHIFTEAGIDMQVADSISQTIWTKFLFISTFATLTSALDLSIGAILINKVHKEIVIRLLTELKNIAEAKSNILPENIVQTLLAKMASLPYGATSSMHSDFKNGNKTEISSLTTYVIQEGNRLNIPTPFYQKMLAKITKRWLL